MAAVPPTSPPSPPVDASLRDELYDAIPFPIYVVDVATLQLVGLNQAMRRKTEALPGETCHWAIYRQDSPCIYCKLAELAGDGPDAATVFELFNDRDQCWYQVHESLLTWYDGRKVKHSIAVDISAQKEAQHELSEAYALLALKSVELEKASVTDALTDLSNRRRLDEVFDHELGRANRYASALSVILADVDRFKHINDSHGHQIGDRVLKGIADILRAGVRSVDTVGRWGGEEFLILCPDTDLAGARAVAEKLRRVVAGQEFVAGVVTTASFGVAQYREGESMKDLLSRADAALYAAKAGGRNRVEG